MVNPYTDGREEEEDLGRVHYFIRHLNESEERLESAEEVIETIGHERWTGAWGIMVAKGIEAWKEHARDLKINISLLKRKILRLNTLIRLRELRNDNMNIHYEDHSSYPRETFQNIYYPRTRD